MSNITVRFLHRRSHTPVIELGVAASATVGALRELLMERLASEEACIMCVFVKWHAQIILPGGQKRLIELTDEDSEASLSSMGISHLSEIHLDGPIIEDSSEGVGQALAIVCANMNRMDKGLERIATLIESFVVQNNLAFSLHTRVPSEAYLARQAVAADEGLAYNRLMVTERAEEGYQRLLAEASDGFSKLSMEARYRPFQFTIDRSTPHKSFDISVDGTTATKLFDGHSTARSSKPLTAANHKWAVKIVENCFSRDGFIIGLLPKLSNAQVAKMEQDNTAYVGSLTLGGWGIRETGESMGSWQCPPFPFGKGDVIVCDLNFAAKTLSLSGGDRKAVGTIPSIKEGDELYPAVFINKKGQSAEFIAK